MTKSGTKVYAKKIMTETTALIIKRKLEYETSRELLREAVKREYGIDAADFTEKRDENGKPYFEGCDIHFNISHSGDWAVCALSDGNVGIDIEKIVPISLRLMWRFFKNNIAIPKEQVRLWTRYESYGKFVGSGIPISDYDIPCAYREYDDIDKYLVTVCAEKDDFSGEIVFID